MKRGWSNDNNKKKPFRLVSGSEIYHVAFEIGNKVISVECNPLQEDEDIMVLWESKDEYLKFYGVEV